MNNNPLIQSVNENMYRERHSLLLIELRKLSEANDSGKHDQRIAYIKKQITACSALISRSRWNVTKKIAQEKLFANIDLATL